MEELPTSYWAGPQITSTELPAATARRLTRRFRLRVLGKDRSIPHVHRKAYHALMGTVCFVLYAFVLTRSQALICLAVVGGLMCTVDVLRLFWPELNAVFLRFAAGVMRREELHALTANTYYVVGVTLVTALFSKPVALLSVLYLAFGDPMASIVGTRYGRLRLVGGKSVEGALGCFIICSLLSFALGVLYLEQSVDTSAVLALCGGTAAVIAELAPLGLDDNLTLPILSALQLSFLLPALGIA